MKQRENPRKAGWNVARVIVAEHYNRSQYWEKEAKRNEGGERRLARSWKRTVPVARPMNKIWINPGVCAVFLANETRFPGGAGFHFVFVGGGGTRNFSSLSGRARSVIKETRASPSILKLRNNFLSRVEQRGNRTRRRTKTGIPFPVSNERRRVWPPFRTFWIFTKREGEREREIEEDRFRMKRRQEIFPRKNRPHYRSPD